MISHGKGQLWRPPSCGSTAGNITCSILVIVMAHQSTVSGMLWQTASQVSLPACALTGTQLCHMHCHFNMAACNLDHDRDHKNRLLSPCLLHGMHDTGEHLQCTQLAALHCCKPVLQAASFCVQCCNAANSACTPATLMESLHSNRHTADSHIVCIVHLCDCNTTSM